MNTDERYGILSGGYKDRWSAEDAETRKRGNELICMMIEMETAFKPELKDCIVSPEHLYNERDDMQSTICDAGPAIEKLIRYRTDERPDTWKWQMPITMRARETEKYVHLAEQADYWCSSSWKGKTAITMMAPSRLIDLICPEYFTYGRDDPRQHVRCEKEGIDNRVKYMEKRETAKTPWLHVSEKLKVGRMDSKDVVSWALAAIRMGIPEMPVYLKKDGWDRQARKKLGQGDTSILCNTLEDFRV